MMMALTMVPVPLPRLRDVLFSLRLYLPTPSPPLYTSDGWAFLPALNCPLIAPHLLAPRPAPPRQPSLLTWSQAWISS